VRERVKDRGYRTLRLDTEHFAEIVHRPSKCKHDYRPVVVRKVITVTEGALD